MKRSVFLLICAIIAALLGSMMLFAPETTAESFAIQSTSGTVLLFQSIGAMIICMGILNFLVRNHKDSQTLKVILLYNVLYHASSITVDMMAVSKGTLVFEKIIVGQVVHIFIIIGAIIYMRKITVTD